MLTRLLKLWGKLFFLYSFLFIFPAGSITACVDSIDMASVEQRYNVSIPMLHCWYSYAAPLVHLCCPFSARVLPFSGTIIRKSLQWLCRKVWDHFFCLQVDELTRFE